MDVKALSDVASNVPLAPTPAVAPAPAPAEAEAPTPIPLDPVLILAATLAPTDTNALAVNDACTFAIVLLEAPFTPAPALAPAPPAPVAAVTRHPLSGSPPFVQVLICALFVVTPDT